MSMPRWPGNFYIFFQTPPAQTEQCSQLARQSIRLPPELYRGFHWTHDGGVAGVAGGHVETMDVVPIFSLHMGRFELKASAMQIAQQMKVA